MRLFIVLAKREARRLVTRFRPTTPRCEKVGVFCKQQVMDRFRTAGASGGTPWPAPKWVKQVGADDGRALLTGATGYLLRSWASYATDATATVSTDAPGAKTNQLGTVGKGGTLPDIRARRAKALFIPLTDRARNSVRVQASQVPTLRRDAYGNATFVRVGVKMRKVAGTKMRAQVFFALVPGRIHEGRLQKRDGDGQWVDGVPDFIWLKRISIPPRPMTPNSQGERDAQARFILDTLMERN